MDQIIAILFDYKIAAKDQKKDLRLFGMKGSFGNNRIVGSVVLP